MPYKKDTRIDTYIGSLPAWQQKICQKVRNLIHEADDAVTETIKRGDKPYFVLSGNICALLAARNHVNVFIYDPIAADPHKLINQGQNNTTARAIQIYEGDRLNDRAFIDLIRAVIANNQAGGWRQLQKHDK